MVDGSGVKAMPGLIPTPNSGSLLKNKKIQVAKWGKPKKNIYIKIRLKRFNCVILKLRSHLIGPLGTADSIICP